MEKWSIGSYRKPFLDVGYFHSDAASGTVEIGEKDSEFALSSESMALLDATLKGLMREDSEHWPALRQKTADPQLQNIGAGGSLPQARQPHIQGRASWTPSLRPIASR